ncbi:MAG: efflux RND transporter periplasmic adaptor subunit [Gammaproteobacteria bacterium]
MKSLLAFIIFITLVSLLAGAWWWLDKNQPEKEVELQQVSPTRVSVTNIIKKDVQLSSRITGRLVPAQRAKLHFEISGQVLERNIEPGQKVALNEQLIRIDVGDYEDVLSEMQIKYDQEKAAIERDQKLLDIVNRQVTLFQREVNRQEKLKKQSLSSQSKIDETRRQLLRERSEQAQLRHSVNTAENRLKVVEVEIKKAQRNIQRTVLKAPVTATVNSVNVSEGDYVSPGQAVLELVQVDELDLHIDIAGKDVPFLSLGQNVTVIIQAKQYQGKLYSLQFDPDPVTHTHSLKIRLNGEGLFPGQLGELQLTGHMVSALIVPITAVLSEDGENYLFRIESGLVNRVPVKLEGRQGDQLLVSGDVKVGDQIVARDVAALENKQQVITQK